MGANKKNWFITLLLMILIVFTSCLSLTPSETKKTSYSQPNKTTSETNKTTNDSSTKKDEKVNKKTMTLPALLAINDVNGEFLNVLDSYETTSGFVVWDCKEYIRGTETLFQIGYFDLINTETNQKDSYGILIFDEPFLDEIKWKEGTPMPGELLSEYEIPQDRIATIFGITPEARLVSFYKEGLNYSWVWYNPKITNSGYEIVLKPDGTVLYYDFTNVPYGESTKASEVLTGYKHIIRGPAAWDFQLPE